MKKILCAAFACVFFTVCVLLPAAGCGTGGSGKLPEDAGMSDADASPGHTAEFSSEKTDWSEDITARITLSGDSAGISGSGCVEKDGVITITDKGTYVFTGSYTGQIRVDADGCKVSIVLCGADITSPGSCPVYIRDSKKTRIILAEGTENTLTDGAEYKEDASLEEQPTAALFSKSDLILEGSGILTVNAAHNIGIRSKDTIEVLGGNYTVNAASHGISGKDSVAVQDGSFIINAGGDGIRSTNEKDGDLGWIYVSGGSFDITSAGEGIKSVNWFTADGGDFSIKAGGGSESGSDGGKGIKASGDIELTGADIGIDSSGDGINTNGSAYISGGYLKISAGDDGIHCDDKLIVSGGSVIVSKCVEGFEGTVIRLSGGDISIAASDDGVSAVSGGSDEDGTRFDVQEGVEVVISGGTVFIDSYGDGIDCNGDLTISGGTTVIDGPERSDNGALDYNGKASVTGGTLLAVGALGMAQGTGEGTSQASVELSFSTPVPAGKLLSVTDPDGNIVAAYAARKQISSFVFCSSDIRDGTEYTVCYGGSCDGEEINGLYTSGTLSGDVTVLGTARARIADKSSGFGGMGGH